MTISWDQAEQITAHNLVAGGLIPSEVYLILTAARLEKATVRICELETECFKLAAGVCEYRGGDEHGNPLCLKGVKL